jgi:hypothetical protein
MRNVFFTTLALGVFAGGHIALAQSGGTTRIRGTIDKVDGDTLGVKSRDGREITLKLDPNYSASAVVKGSLSDIKPNSFVGVAAAPLPDGSLRALEVHIFPEAQRGTGEGSRDYDLEPKSTMTNGAVSGSVASNDGRTLTISYKGGAKKVQITPSTPIVTFSPASKDDLKPGAGIVVQAATRIAENEFRASRFNIGRDGVNPPM